MSTGFIEPALGVKDLKAFLQGNWLLTRCLRDLRAGTQGTLAGEALFETEGDELVYRENGVLRLGDGAFKASRVYRYGFPAPHRAEVAFDDGSLFHVLDLSSGSWAVEHLCGADSYRGKYIVAGFGEWQVNWQVVGPRKDQLLESRYLRGG